MKTVAENISDTKIRFGGFSEPLKEYRLGDITETISRPIKMDNEEDYLLVTVKRRNEGIVERGIYKGKEVKVKSQFKVDAGDFLISKRQIIHGACEIVPNKLAGAIVSNEYHILHGKKELLLTEYLNLLSKTPKLKNYFALACVGVDIEKMLFRIEDWKKRVVKIPSIEEQRKIVAFFNLFNRKLEKQKEKIEKLEQFKKGIMQKVFSQDLRFKDEDGGGFGEWEETTFGEVSISMQYGMNSVATEFDGENKYIRITDIDESSRRYIENGKVSPLGKLSEDYRIKLGDILFARTGASTGKSYLYKESDGKMYYAGFLIRLRVRDGIDSRFVYYQTFLKEYDQWVKVMSMRSGQPGINAQEYSSYKFSLPSIEEQIRIADFLDEIENKIEKEREKLMVLEEQKKGFMQGMFA